jgi:hypothetical protein
LLTIIQTADFQVLESMEVSPFDRLPDELLVRILGMVTKMDFCTSVGRPRAYDSLQSFLQAQLVCKRWWDLAFRIPNLSWVLDGSDDSMDALEEVILDDR